LLRKRERKEEVDEELVLLSFRFLVEVVVEVDSSTGKLVVDAVRDEKGEVVELVFAEEELVLDSLLEIALRRRSFNAIVYVSGLFVGEV